MLTLNAITILFNALTLSLALGFLLIVLWNDSQNELNQFYAIFLCFVICWSFGSLFVQSVSFVPDIPGVFVGFSVSIMELGFTGASISIYVLATVLAGILNRRLRVLFLLNLVFIVGIRIFLIVNNNSDISVDEALDFYFHPLAIFFYGLFDITTLYITWRYRRRFRSFGLIAGIVIFVVGQSLTFINPEISVASFASTISSVGVLLISGAILQQEIITPLAEKNSQVETLHKVSLAITSELSINIVLDEIAKQAAGWVSADGVGIFLSEGDELELVNVYQLPSQLTHMRLSVDRGVVGKVMRTRKSAFLENYRRDWSDKPDFALAKETFGSVIAVPLEYSKQIIGVLMVVSGFQGRLFNEDDVHALELLSAQAAVAIVHGRVFTEQRALTEQLETLLTSTQNPVIAVDRKFRLIFANSAVRNIISLSQLDSHASILPVLPEGTLPKNYVLAIREMHHNKSFVYDIVLDDRVYQCHVAILGHRRIDGWVAVLNDVTQLIELDRLKSEMVRMASHDLKNPLMGAMTNMELLKEDLVHSEELETLANLVERQLERMHRIINGILDVERMKIGLNALTTCSANQVIENSLAELSLLISDKQIRVNIDVEETDAEFIGDCEQFQRVIINLLENAIKFTLDDGEVYVRTYCKDNSIIFSIKDNGVGIPEHLYDKIFDRFYRGEQESVRHVSGTGLGLSLVRSVVENHNGKVWFVSEENIGSTFYVSVPIKE